MPFSHSDVVEPTAAKSEERISIRSDVDVVTARSAGRTLAERIGFGGAELAAITTAISEVARNIVQHARGGEITVETAQQDQRTGIEIVARDGGPGIADIDKAMEDGYSTTDGLGLGLPGAQRLVDEFEIHSEPGRGTHVTMRKWRSLPG